MTLGRAQRAWPHLASVYTPRQLALLWRLRTKGKAGFHVVPSAESPAAGAIIDDPSRFRPSRESRPEVPALPAETPTRTAAELLREVAAADPEAHRRALARGYGVGPAETEQPAKWMQWRFIEHEMSGNSAEIVAWVNANDGEARYDPRPESGALTGATARIAVRTVDGWAYAEPGQYVVMGDETFYVKRTGLSDYAVRSFSVADSVPTGTEQS